MRSASYVQFVLALSLMLFVLSGCPSQNSDPVLLETQIVKNTTVAAGAYRVNSSIVVSGNAVLTLSPGTTLRFAADTGLFVNSDGALNAVGTQDAPIVLTGQTTSRGYWLGLTYTGSNSQNNTLEYVTIEYGGKASTTVEKTSDRFPANLTLELNSLLAVRNCTLRESATYGFNFAPNSTGAEVTAFSNNTITRNALGAGQIEACHAGYLEDTSSYTGNDIDVVMVGGSAPTTILADETWPALDVHYFITSDLLVDHKMTIAPGARLLFESKASLILGEAGGIYLNGTAEKNTMIARQPSPYHSDPNFGTPGPFGPSWNSLENLYTWSEPWQLEYPYSYFGITNPPPWFKPPLPQTFPLDGINFQYIPAGSYFMGSPDDESGHYYENEFPLHKVQLTRGFYLSQTEITQGQWRRVMGTQLPYSMQDSIGDNLPMRRISWHDAQAFAVALQVRNSASTFRLPTEAEWEFAARADTTTRFYWGDDPTLANCDTYAWTVHNSVLDGDGSYSINEVGLLRPNPWHLLDMSGNVLEWVQDRYHDNYNSAPGDGSAWGTPERSFADDPLTMVYGVVRGGCSNWSPEDVRSAFRYSEDPESRRPYTRFRIVMEE